ncbi:hypothetical protein [Streptomyces sp. NPDC007205]
MDQTGHEFGFLFCSVVQLVRAGSRLTMSGLMLGGRVASAP